MTITIKPSLRAAAIGIGAAVLLVCSFLLGSARNGSAATAGPDGNTGTVPASASGTGRITVTGTGTATGTPNQLVLTMGVRVSSYSVSSAVAQANQAQRRVIAALRAHGVPAADIQTTDFTIQPNYRSGSQLPSGYGVSEQLTATLTNLRSAGSQIQAAVTAGGNATTVDGVTLNMTDTGPLLRSARSHAIGDARAKAAQYASALGEHITGVLSVSDQASTTPYPVLNAGLVAQSRAPVPVKPGTQQVSVQITVVFSIA